MGNWNQLSEKAHNNALSHGFWEGDPSDQHFLCLVVTELSEAVEAHRKSKRANRFLFDQNKNTPQPQDRIQQHWDFCFKTLIKDSLEDELADSVIRLLDLAGKHDVDLDGVMGTVRFVAPDQLREKTFTEAVWEIITVLTDEDEPIWYTVTLAIYLLEQLAQLNQVNLMWHVEAKMKYNSHRENKHGKLY